MCMCTDVHGIYIYDCLCMSMLHASSLSLQLWMMVRLQAFL